MFGVRLAWQGIRAASLPATWRKSISLPAAALPGLLARQWLLDRATLEGCYLFDEDERAVLAFLANPAADPAYAMMASLVAEAGNGLPEVRRLARAPEIVRPVFIVAAPRSGSTVLFDLLSQAPGLWTRGCEGQGAVDGVVKLHPAARRYESDRLDADDLTPEILRCLHAGLRFGLRDRHGCRYDDAVEVDAMQGPRLLDKTTEHTLRVAFLARACPDARFVLLHRDPRQNVSSLMHAWRHGGFVRLHDLPDWPQRDWCFLLPPGWRDLRGRSLQSVATAQWQAACHWALHDLEMLEPARWTHVDYNELVSRPRQVMERVCAFLDIEVDAHLAKHLDRPLAVSATAISPPSTIKWRSHGELDVPLLEAETRTASARLRSLHDLHGPAETAHRATAVGSDVRFACLLDDIAAEGEGAEPSRSTLFVEFTLRFQLGTSIPLGLAKVTRFRERFVADRPILWSQDLLTKAWRPYWVPRHQASLFDHFQPAAQPPPCSFALCRRLQAVGILASTSDRAVAEQRAALTRARLQGEFVDRGYCVVTAALGAAHTAALARYYRELIGSGRWAIGDAQVARRHGWHNESVARFFHHQLTGFVGAVVGELVCPSYTYVSAYQQGAELAPHIDRKQCEYTLSIAIDETGGRSRDWPLWFLVGNDRSAITLDVGEGVLFRGHDMPHWRETPPQSALALSTLLLHYVSANFRETLD